MPVVLLLGPISGIIIHTGRVFLIPIHQLIPVPGIRGKRDGRNAVKDCVLSIIAPKLTPGQGKAAI